VTGPAWTILIATLGRRAGKLAGLLEELMAQVDAAGGAVTVEALWNNGERPVSVLRRELLQGARSRYVSFVDDDDAVASNYVARILPLLDGTDYVGFNVRVMSGTYQGVTACHSLRNPGWSEDILRDRLYRHVSHLNPIRRELALLGSFGDAAYGEDREWAHAVRAHVRTEHFVDQVMYFYYPAGELGDPPGPVPAAPACPRTEVASPNFSWHPASTEARA
jgi:hypothetical protein